MGNYLIKKCIAKALYMGILFCMHVINLEYNWQQWLYSGVVLAPGAAWA